MEDEIEKTEEQPKEQLEDRIKPWQFKPGQSGNPSGRPKGSKSLKQFSKEYLASLTNEEKLKYITGMDKRVIWEMGEDKPKQGTDLTSGGEKIQFAIVNYGNKDNSVQVHAEGVSDSTTPSTG